jgi:ribose 5-phosphate isomerase B
MRIALGADHAGFQLKDSLKRTLDDLGVSYEDFGTGSGESVDYPDFAHELAARVGRGEAERGILVCGTGIGMAMAASKIDGIRAANVTDPEFAKLAREHNDANVVAVSGRFVPERLNEQIVDAFLDTAFGGGRHAGRVDKITQAELDEA